MSCSVSAGPSHISSSRPGSAAPASSSAARAAGLASERATPEQIATLAEEVASLFAAIPEPERFLVHDINFHRAVAAASANPIVASLVEMVSALYYEQRRDTAARASERDLREAAEMHRRIYQAIRAHDAHEARNAMNDHLIQASRNLAQEAVSLLHTDATL